MTTVPIHVIPYLRDHADRQAAARQIADTHVDDNTPDLLLLADGRKLRGIPAVGRWTSGGHIAGTQPEAATCR